MCVYVCLQAEVIKESAWSDRGMFTLSFCFPYKSQSHNISFSTASWAAQRPRPLDGDVIWRHKTSLQRAVPHSNIYWPIKRSVIWVKRVPVFRCSPLTERCRLGEKFIFSFGTDYCLGEFYGELDVLKRYVCLWEGQEGDSGALLTSWELMFVHAQFRLWHCYRQECLSVLRATTQGWQKRWMLSPLHCYYQDLACTSGYIYMCSIPDVVCHCWTFCLSPTEVLNA